MTDHKPLPEFLEVLRTTLHSAFYERNNLEEFIQFRGFPDEVLKEVMGINPFAVAIPTKYGGRGANVKECLGVLDCAAYESLPLSLLFGINIGLFLEPVAKYAHEEVKADIFQRFLTRQNMGGLMITEPDHGSDALNMQTTYTRTESGYHVKGTKHWQGLTGMADYWLIASRRTLDSGELGRDIDFFICDVRQPEQVIIVEEYFNNIGLYPIPYGRNSIDIQVPEMFKLKPETTGLKMLMDILHRSRFQIPGMGMGFIRRMLDEAISQCTTRFIGGRPLIALDQVSHQVSRIQSAFTISSAMCARSAEFSGIENNLATADVEANSMKAHITDLMQESAQTLTQLNGANGYRVESVGSRGIVDSRPFQIFEGSNDMLYTQISEKVLKHMERLSTMNLGEFLRRYELTSNVADQFRSLLDFTLDQSLPQRKVVDLGKIISRVISAAHVNSLGAKGFRPDLVRDSIESIRHEVSGIVSSFSFQTSIIPIEEYKENGSWMSFC